MFRSARRKGSSTGYRPPMLETLEDRRLLSADHIAAGLQLNVPRHLTAVAEQRVNLDLGVVGPNIPPGTIALSVHWGRGKSALQEDAFLLGNGDGTSDVFVVNPLNLAAGTHPMRLTISADGAVVATVSRSVHFLPHSDNGLALRSARREAVRGNRRLPGPTARSGRSAFDQLGRRIGRRHFHPDDPR